MKVKLIMLLLCHITSVGLAIGQNLYLEVIDAASYRGIPNVTVDLESEMSNISFTTAVDGSISESVPAGRYTITLSRPGYRTFVEPGVIVRRHELTTISFVLKPQEGVDHPTDVSSQGYDPGAAGLTDSPHNGYVGFGYGFSNIQAFNLSFAYFIKNQIYAFAGYAYGQEAYSNIFFVSTDEFDIAFNSFIVGAGLNYEFSFPNDYSLFLRPDIAAGTEIFSNKNYFDYSNIDLVMQGLFKPGVQLGLNVNRFGFGLGINYLQWISGPMTQKRIGLYNNETDDKISWNRDLFHDRGGLGFSAGLIIYF